MTSWTVVVEYDSTHVGFDLDEPLRALARRSHLGSGTDLRSGTRDHSWRVSSRRAAERLQSRLLTLLSRRRLPFYSVRLVASAD
jgi:hypothetical protein